MCMTVGSSKVLLSYHTLQSGPPGKQQVYDLWYTCSKHSMPCLPVCLSCSQLLLAAMATPGTNTITKRMYS